MTTYAPPVSRLVKLGEPNFDDDWADYSTYGIGPEDVPELIRLLSDEELAWADSDLPDVYAQVHAWRALGQLRSEAAIEPLLGLLADQEDEEKWSEWVTEEVPCVLGMIGPVALGATADRMHASTATPWVRDYYAFALTEIAKRHPDARDEVIQHLCRALENAAGNDPSFNGSLIADLLDLRAQEAWPTIERALATGDVDELMVGDEAHVKWRLGLGPMPPEPEFEPWPTLPKPVHVGVLTRLAGGRTAKERAEYRALQRKAEKRRRKRKQRKTRQG
jgi:hypothetical protein